MMFTTLVPLVLSTASFVLAAPYELERRGVPAPAGFNITSLTGLGSGCPAGTASAVVSDDRTAVTVVYSQFLAQAGPGIPISEQRKNCQLTFGIKVPGGFSFAIAQVDYRGFYSLDDKVEASQNALYYFQAQTNQITAHSTIVGPKDGEDYTFTDKFGISTLAYSPCGKTTVLNVNSDVRVNNSKNKQGSGIITEDSTDASFTQVFNLQWKKC